MKHIFLSLLFATLILASSFSFAEEKSTSTIKTVHMQIEGMTCSGCASEIQKDLAPLCQEASIDHKTGHGMCTYDSIKTNQEAVVKVVNDAGYKVTSAH